VKVSALPPAAQAAARRRMADEQAAHFLALLRCAGLPAPVREHRFEPLRKWAFDFAWPALRVALEVEGGVWTGGRHTSPAGFLADCAKYNHAAALGWRVLRVTPDQLCTVDTTVLLTRTLDP
jgi:very-short-patch-repair endonuclease